MGYNTWNADSCAVTEADVREAAEALVETGLAEAGYECLVVDDCWMAGELDADGRLWAHSVEFPSGIGALADSVHDRGLAFGLYSSAGSHTCQGYPASLGRERRHAEQFAEWGVDYLKYDNCGDHRGRDAVDRYGAMGRALAATDREIVYSICEWGENEPWRWGSDVGGDLWRVTDDVVAKWRTDPGEFGLGIANAIDRIAALEIAPAHGPGGYNDPDMLQVGNGPEAGQSQHEPVDVRRPLTEAETRTHFGMWCLLGAPLFVGTDLGELSATDLAVLTNERLIAIDQDPLGRQATPVRRNADREIWSKRLDDGGAAVGLYNCGSETARFRAQIDEVAHTDRSDRYHVLDCWSGDERSGVSELVAEVPPRATAVRRVTPNELCG
jgi:alpha-galactosidase